MDDNQAFYSAVAQVLPVFFLALAINWRVLEADEHLRARTAFLRFFIVCLLALGEVAALIGLKEGGSYLIDSLAWAALAGCGGVVLSVLFPRAQAREVGDRVAETVPWYGQHRDQVAFGFWIGLLVGGAALILVLGNT